MGRNVSFKKEKVSEKILNSINSFFRTQANDPRLKFISVTSVDVNHDYSKAVLMWDTFDVNNKESAQVALDVCRGKVRSHLANVLKARFVPEIEFKYDSQYEDEKKIEDLLKGESSSTL